ncbi:MAG: hypothetical protein WC390_08630 [Sulfurimonas sp.]|jgi:hypothetical protein
MSAIKITIDCELDGQRLPGYPLSRRIAVDESTQFSAARTTGGGYVSIPISDLAALKALILTADQAITLRLDAQSDAGIELNAGGILAIIDATIDAGASTNATVSNASGSDVQLEGVAAG